jgi:D-alanyl-D-alanine carboxypeptidase
VWGVWHLPAFYLAAAAHYVLARLQRLLSEFRAEYAFPGAAAAIVLPSGDRATGATDVSNAEADNPMTPDIRMLAASIGKSFVAATALALETDGFLQRSDLVSACLGDRDWFARLPNHVTMTVGDLLRHSACLPDHLHLQTLQTEMAQRMAQGGTPLSPEEAMAFVFDAEPLFPAGSAWACTDTGYLLFGLVIEDVTGRAYFDLVAERFLGPLGLFASTPSNGPRLPGIAVGYVVPDNPFGLPSRTMDLDGNLLWNPALEWIGGGLASTSGYLARWGHALFGGTAKSEGRPDGAP